MAGDCPRTLHLILMVILRFLGHSFACFALVLGGRGLAMMVFCCVDGIMSSRWCAVDMVGLCLRSRGHALLRCVWDGVGCL